MLLPPYGLLICTITPPCRSSSSLPVNRLTFKASASISAAMPNPQNQFPSVQLQSYITEHRVHGSVPPFTVDATDEAVTSKQAVMKEYLEAWEENWNRIGHLGSAG
jgi:hypothetical protein